MALLLIGAAWCGSRGGSSGTTPALDRASAGRPVEALPETERQLLDAVARQPEDARVHQQLGSHYLAAGRPFEALWELQEARALDPNDVATGLGLANALAAARLPDRAIAALTALVKRHPEGLDLRRRLADLYLTVGQPESAVAALRRAPDLHRSPEALSLLARTYHSLKQYEPAERALEEARRLLPDAWEPVYHLGRLYLERRDLLRAEQMFLAARTSAPDRPEPHHGLGLRYLQGSSRLPAPGSRQGRRQSDRVAAASRLSLGAGKGTRAIWREATARGEEPGAAFRAALQIDTAYAPAHRELGLLLLERRQYREAGDHFLQAIRGAKDVDACRAMAEALTAVGRRVESQYYWGLYFTRKDLRPRAAAAFQAMAALDRERTEAVLLLTETYIRMNQERRGIGVVTAALQRHPHERALQERLATLYIGTVDPAAAARVCQAWLREDPNAAAPHWVLGRITVETPRVEEGLRELELAVAREPRNPEFAYTLASGLLRRPTEKNRQRAIRLLEEAIRKAPDVARYRKQLGMTLRQQGDQEGARQQLLRSLDLDPHQASIYSNLVALATQLRRSHQVRFWAPLVRAVEDRSREELQLWRAVWDHPEDAAAYYRLASFLMRTGEPAKAQSQLEEGLRLRPDWPEAKAMLERVSGIVQARSP